MFKGHSEHVLQVKWCKIQHLCSRLKDFLHSNKSSLSHEVQRKQQFFRLDVKPDRIRAVCGRLVNVRAHQCMQIGAKQNEKTSGLNCANLLEQLHTISWCTYCGNKLIWEPECLKFEREPKAVTGGGFTGGEREGEREAV